MPHLGYQEESWIPRKLATGGRPHGHQRPGAQLHSTSSERASVVTRSSSQNDEPYLHPRVWLGEAPRGCSPDKRMALMKQALDPGAHPTCSPSLGLQAPGASLVLSPPCCRGRGVGMVATSADRSLSIGLPCSASLLPACRTFQLLPAPPVPMLVPGLCPRGCPWAHLFIPHHELLLSSSSWHP